MALETSSNSEFQPDRHDHSADPDYFRSPLESQEMLVPRGRRIEHLAEQFQERFEEALADIRDFSMSNPSGDERLLRLREVLKDPTSRAIAKAHLSQQVGNSFAKSGRGQALLYVLSEYFAESPVLMAQLYANSLRGVEADEGCFQFVGELFHRNNPPCGSFMSSAVEAFCNSNCYNVDRLPEFKPWIEYFAKNARQPTLERIGNELGYRLSRGHLSSYDHLLSVLTRSHDVAAAKVLKDLLGFNLDDLQNELREIPGMLPDQPSFMTEMQINAVTYLGLFTGMGMLFGAHDFTIQSFGTDLLLAEGLAFIITRLRRGRQEMVESALHEMRNEIAKSPVISIFGERVFREMKSLASNSNPQAIELLEQMKNSNLYRSLIPVWEEVISQTAH